MNHFKIITGFFGIYLFASFELFACTGGTNAGTISPTASYQTQAVSSGQYFAVNVICGQTYNFTFCSNGGAAAWDTQITINQTNNTTQLAYNDDNCGLQSNVTWTANFTGTIHVLISQYSCNNSGSVSGTMAYNVSSPVNYTSSCTTASATVSGITSPSFSFNPLPGDGATINATTGAISNATMGATYSVQIVHSCGTINKSVTMGNAPCYTLSGNAQTITVGGEQCFQLTAEINNQTGCAWSQDPVDFGSNFNLSLNYYFGNNINGADGNTFSFQPNPTAGCGQNGGQLGAGGIPNTLSVEFDTYDNDNPTHLYDMACDHVAVEIDGNMLGPGAPYCGPVCAKAGGGNIDDGGTYQVEINWNSTTQQLTIYFNGVLRLTCSGNFVSTVFGGQSTVYWGATSATGGLNNQQYFCPSTVTVLPAEMVSFSSVCEDEVELITWETASENNVDRFDIEYTLNGLIYYSIGSIEAAGNSTEMTSYSFRYSPTDHIQKYFRIKTVDLDGNFETSDLIASKNCLESDMLISYSFENDGLFIQSNSSKNMIELFNTAGQEIQTISNTDSSSFFLSNLNLSGGIYLLKITDAQTGQFKMYRIYK